MRTTKQTKMTNMKFDRISRQQYVIVFQKRWARWSSLVDGCLAPPPTQKIYHVDALGKDTPKSLFNFP